MEVMQIGPAVTCIRSMFCNMRMGAYVECMTVCDYQCKLRCHKLSSFELEHQERSNNQEIAKAIADFPGDSTTKHMIPVNKIPDYAISIYIC